MSTFWMQIAVGISPRTDDAVIASEETAYPGLRLFGQGMEWLNFS